MTSSDIEGKSEDNSERRRGHFSELLKIQGKLALREPSGVMGIALPFGLLVVFALISSAVPGNVGDTTYTTLDIYIPVVMVIGFVFIALGLPTTIVRDREIGWLRRISTTPVHPSRLLATQLIINLIFALVTVLIIIFGAVVIFGAVLDVNLPLFVLSLILSIATIFSLGLVLVAIAPSQAAATGLGGVFIFGLMFLSGLWTPPQAIGGPLATIIYYSPSGAAVRALLNSIFNQPIPYATVVTLVVYTTIFAFLAIRYFRWE
ncbi:MAG TPA: ABC transporter permease [Nitrososphaerales archaeon]|nr:ABC transporter permease [Nitrososphaerales archaeon]